MTEKEGRDGKGQLAQALGLEWCLACAGRKEGFRND